MADSDWTTSPAFFGPKNGLNFDGGNDYVDCGNNASLQISGSTITLEAWINVDVFETNLYEGTIIDKHGDLWKGYGLRCGASGILDFNLGDGSGWHSLTSPENVLSTGKWHHVAGIYDGTTQQLYVDGVLVASSTTSFSISANTVDNLYLGEGSLYNNRLIDGKMDEVRIWNTARTEAQIREYMNKTLTGNESGLAVYYNFDNSTGTILQDFSGNANDGTLTNMDPANDWVASTAFNTWLNTNSTTWATASNWSDGVPVSTDNVGIYNYTYQPASSADLSVNNLFLGSSSTFGFTGSIAVAENAFLNSSLTIGSGKYITVDGGLVIESSGGLTVESGGSLITNGTVSGDATIEKTISDTDWHLISVPNAVTESGTFVGNYLEPWNETAGSWSNIEDEVTLLNPAQGYGFKDYDGSGTYTFTGTPNTGDQEIAITYTENGSGFKGANLVGNPYPSSIDWGTVSGYGACYLWNGTAYEAYPATGDFVIASQYIAPMQGFFIVVDASAVADASGKFNLTNTNRVHTGAATNFYKSSSTLTNGIVLTASNGSYLDELYLVFDESSSDEFELERDAYKFLSNTEGLSQLYSFNQETKFSIDVRPEEGSIQLGFKNDKDDVYQIGLKELEGISGAFLEDTKLSVFHNLENGDYQFEWSVSDSEKRFKFHLSTTGFDDIKVNLAQLYAFQKTLYIQSNENLHNASIRIIDVTGREVYQQALKNTQSETIALAFANGVYTVVLSSDEGVQIKKIIFN